MPRIESGADALKLREAADHQAGANRQDQRERDLGDDQQPLHAAVAAARDAAPAVLQGLDQRRARGAQRRHQAEHHAADRRHGEREEEHRHVHAHFVETRNALRRHRQQRLGAPRRQQQADEPRHDREHDALGDELRDDAAAAGAERAADGDLALARRRPREQEVRDIRGRNQQQESDRAEQHVQDLADVADDARPAAAPRRSSSLPAPGYCRLRPAATVSRFARSSAIADAGLQARQAGRVERPAPRRRVHRQRPPDVDVAHAGSGSRPASRRRRHG